MGANARPGLHERDLELAVIMAEWQLARTGSGRLVVIEGPAGIGKTGLLRAARAAIVSDEVRVLAARAGELERHFPFGLVHQLLDAVVYGATPDERDALFSGAAHLAAGLFAHEQASGGDDAEAFPRLHGLFWLMANVAVRQPLLVLVDDAQWADDASLGFLAFLIRRLEDAPILLVVATRPAHGEERGQLTQLVADPSGRVLRPASLSRAAVASWLNTTLKKDADSAFVDACHATTRGNPLLVAELVREVAARRLTPSAAAAQEVSTVTSHGVTAVVLLRLTGMPTGACELAAAVAVLGDGADLWSAAELAGLVDADAAVALDALVRGGLFEGGAEGLCFSHPLIRSSIYQDLGPLDRAQAHERAARQLQARRAKPDEVASHLLVTRPAADEAVVDVLREAARAAAGLGVPETAAAYLRRALAEPPRDEIVGDVCLELGCAAARAGAPDAEEHMRRAVELAASPVARSRAALELARWLTFAGRAVEAVAILDSALADRSALGAELADALEGELVTVAYVSASARRLVHYRLDLGLDKRSDELAVLALAVRGFDAATTGTSAAAAADFSARALAGGQAPNDPVAGGYWRLTAGMASMWSDRFDLAERCMDGMLAEARSHGSAMGLGVANSMRSHLHLRRGALPDAEADARFAMEMALRGRQRRRVRHGCARGAGAGRARAWSVARGAGAARRRTRGSPGGHRRAALRGRSLRPGMLARRSRRRPRRARRPPYRRAVLLRLGSGGPGCDPVAIGRRAGRQPARREPPCPYACAEELELARRFGAPRALGIALRAEALVAADGSTESLLAEAVAVLEGSGARLELARVLIDLGAVMRRGGRRVQARELLRRGLELAARCGAERLAAHGRDELQSTGARPRRIALSGVESLTPSERRVAQLAADANTNREIAQALFVTEKTVESHLAHAFDKLGVRSRTRLRDALGEALPA